MTSSSQEDSTAQSNYDVYAWPNQDSSPRSVYIHVPFCLHRCGYCDFTLVAGRDELIPAYLGALKNELATQDCGIEVDTIFIGGGTPTHLDKNQLEQLLQLVTSHFSLHSEGEFSVEANPDGLGPDRFEVLQQFGVNRLSLGVQAFDDVVLKKLERQHTREEAVSCVQQASEWFSSVAVDLIFGVPGQSLQQWQQSLSTTTELHVQHVSTYGLTYEKGTQFYARLRRGHLSPTDDEAEREMYATAIDHLTVQGLEHYEVSNFAKPGRHSRHNMTYWNADEYFGFGPGAARYVNGVRSTNSRNVTQWISSWQNGVPVLDSLERLSNEEAAREAIMLGLRKNSGIRLSSFERKFGMSVETLAGLALQEHLNADRLEIDDDHLRLSFEGRFVADSVMVDFL